MPIPLSRLILDRLAQSAQADIQTRKNEARQILQELLLYRLQATGFFKEASFHGGTCLRIFYGTLRYSEDLDFSLTVPDKKYCLTAKLEKTLEDLSDFGLDLEIKKRKNLGAVQGVFIKDQALCLQLGLQREQKIRIKVEIDTNPPEGATTEAKVLSFPLHHYIHCHDQPTLFAGKLHALLCRSYEKGRDWFDFLYYAGKKIEPNWNYLNNALLQIGYNKTTLPAKLDTAWLKKELKKRFLELGLEKLLSDVTPFIKRSEDLQIWSKEFFIEQIKSL